MTKETECITFLVEPVATSSNSELFRLFKTRSASEYLQNNFMIPQGSVGIYGFRKNVAIIYKWSFITWSSIFKSYRSKVNSSWCFSWDSI